MATDRKDRIELDRTMAAQRLALLRPYLDRDTTLQFKSLTDAIDTSTPSGRFFFHVMASLAEMERELTVERTRAGLETARQLGRRGGGRKRKMTDSKLKSAKKLLANGIPPKEVAKNLGVSIPTLYRWIRASENV